MLFFVKKNGFTLVELAVVLVIIGVVISIIATVLPALLQSSKIRKAQAILEKVDYSVEGYVAGSRRFPCPDTDGDGKENRSGDDCDAYVGDLPYVTLGLGSGDDNWGNRLKYGVYQELAQTDDACTTLAELISDMEDNPDQWPQLDRLHVTNDDDVSTNMAYVIVSGGPKDLDDHDEFFDQLNTGSDVEFEADGRIITTSYDDIVRATSIVYLHGRDCTGGGGTGSSSGTTSSGGTDDDEEDCTNGTDDDGDGRIDCDDPDCVYTPECAESADVQIDVSNAPAT